MKKSIKWIIVTVTIVLMGVVIFIVNSTNNEKIESKIKENTKYEDEYIKISLEKENKGEKTEYEFKVEYIGDAEEVYVINGTTPITFTPAKVKSNKEYMKPTISSSHFAYEHDLLKEPLIYYKEYDEKKGLKNIGDDPWGVDHGQNKKFEESKRPLVYIANIDFVIYEKKNGKQRMIKYNEGESVFFDKKEGNEPIETITKSVDTFVIKK